MKKRFSFLDVAAVVLELQKKLLNLRLSNIYDINPKTYLLKFARNEIKEYLIVESGVRFHITNYSRQKENTRSIFAMKLRKYIRTRRLTSVKQLGTDRIVDLCFGEGEASYHLILEFYSSGNVILTDYEYRILSILRPVLVNEEETNEKTKFAVGEIYDISMAKEHIPMTMEELQESIRKQISFNTSEEKDEISSSTTSQIQENQQNIDINTKSNQQNNKESQKDQKAPMTKKEKRRLKEIKEKTQQQQKKQQQQQQNKKQKAQSQKNITLNRFIKEKFSEKYGPSLIEHIIKESTLDPNIKILTELDISPDSPHMKCLFNSFQKADEIVYAVSSKQSQGYILSHKIKLQSNTTTATNNKPSVSLLQNQEEQKVEVKKEDGASEANESEKVIYDEYHPYLFSQFTKNIENILTFPTFNEAIDEYYSKMEAHQIEQKMKQNENMALKKLDNVRKVQEDRVKGLEAACEQSVEMAQAIEANLDYVDQLIQVIRSFIATGMDWVDLENMLADERKAGNPFALAIKELKLLVGMISIQLMHPNYMYASDDDDSEEESDNEEENDDDENSNRRRNNNKNNAKKNTENKKYIVVDIDIYTSAYANARRYYDMKRSASAKQEKTLQAAEKALKSAEKKIAKEMNISNTPVKSAIVKVRKPYWFEKFHWFISSENYLVLAGRDAILNEQLVRKYLKKGDIYIHADIHGASTVIIKNTNQTKDTQASIASGECPIPPTTLLQAGTMAVCYSKAWESNVITSAYWVYDHQVSKTAPSGEYLTTGSFMIRGKKNWLPPVQLVYGFGFLFKVDDSNIPRHYWERRPWGRDNEENDEEMNKAIVMKREKQKQELKRLNDIVGVNDDDDDNDDNDSDNGNDNENDNNKNSNNDNDDIIDVITPQKETDNKLEEIEKIKDDITKNDENIKSKSDSTESIESNNNMNDEEREEDENDADADSDDSNDEFEFPDTQISAPKLINSNNNNKSTVTNKNKEIVQNMNEKYNLSEIGNDEDDLDEEDSQDNALDGEQSKRKHISAIERRQLRKKKRQEKKITKQLLLENDENTTTTNNESDSKSLNQYQNDERGKGKGKKEKKKFINEQNKNVSKDTAISILLQSNVRGKKGKIKKVKEKYLDQDEEERQIRMELLGSLNKKEKKKKGKQKVGGSKNSEKLTTSSTTTLNTNPTKANNNKKGNNNSNIPNENISKNATTSSKTSVEKLSKQKEKEEIEQILKEENIPILEEEQLESLLMLDELTGQPFEDDELLYAVPICAPWSSLQKIKYRVKLLPGGVKKGKLVRSVTNNFLQLKNATEREKELIRNVHESEMIGTIGLSKCEAVNDNASSLGGGNKKKKRTK